MDRCLSFTAYLSTFGLFCCVVGPRVGAGAVGTIDNIDVLQGAGSHENASGGAGSERILSAADHGIIAAETSTGAEGTEYVIVEEETEDTRASPSNSSIRSTSSWASRLGAKDVFGIESSVSHCLSKA